MGIISIEGYKECFVVEIILVFCGNRDEIICFCWSRLFYYGVLFVVFLVYGVVLLFRGISVGLFLSDI